MTHTWSRVSTIVVLVLFFHLVLAGRAEAYLDPGTGSYIFQMLAAIVLTAAFTIKHYWKKLKVFFSRRGHARKVEDESPTS